MAQKKHTNWANVLTWTRLVLLVPITIAAYLDMRWTVFWLFIIAGLTDFFDGKVARWAGVASAEGALFDSRVDNALAPFLFLWLWLLFPILFRDFLIWIILVAILIALQLCTAHWKLGVVTGLHLWSDKLAATAGFLLLPSLILFGYVPGVIWTVIVISIYAHIEGIAYVLKGGKNLDARWFFDK